MSTTGDWTALDWAYSDNYYAATIADTFLSRRSYLRAPANVTSTSIASATMAIPQADEYSVMMRYEATYRFETPFEVTITQGET